MSIRARLFIAIFVVVGAAFATLLHWILNDLRPRYLETMEESMVDTATLLSSFLAIAAEDGGLDCSGLRSALDDAKRRRFSAKIFEVTKTRLDLGVYVTDALGTVVFDSAGGKDEGADYSRWNDVRRTLDGTYGARTSQLDPDDPGSSALFVASPIERDGRTIGVVTVWKPSGSVREFLSAARRKIIVAGALAALAAVALGMVVSARIAGPIRRLTEYAKAVRDGRRVPRPRLGGSEVGSLGVAFDEMREALDGTQYVEEYIATLTHEMKGPLSAIQGAAELLEDDAMPAPDRRRFLGNIRVESARLRELVDRLLELSSLEKRRGLRDVGELDLAEVLREVTRALEPILSARRLKIEWGQDDPVRVIGERFLVRQCLANLLQNAAEFSPLGGTIRLDLAVHRDEGWVEVRIRDHGPGVPTYALGRVFDRFYSLARPDSGKKGSGLGLTFVREAVALHGGTVRLENAEGGGARAVLRLPVKPAAGSLEG